MLARTVERIKALLAPVIGDRRGAAAMILAFTMIPMFGAVGLAVDSSLGYLLRSRMSKALDTAGLAAGRVVLSGGAEDVAREYFDANFGEDEGAATLTDFTFELDETERFVTLTARATTPTFFMRIFGRDQMEVASRTVIERETTGMELALVLDNTKSMDDDDKFEAMQEAAFDLIEILYGTETEIDDLWVSVVPFIASVNVGTAHKSWLAATDKAYTQPTTWWGAEGWGGCFMERSGSYGTDDTPPGSQKFTSYRWPQTGTSYNWPPIVAHDKGPNVACGAPILPLTASREEIEDALDAMTIPVLGRGGTTANIGLVWGWRTLSPSWRGLWGGSTPADMPLDYDTPLMEKVVVLLTDGQNQVVSGNFSGHGTLSQMGVSTTAQSTTQLNTRTTTVCDNMEAAGIRVFTIVFGAEPNTTTQNLMRNCATSPAMYYYAPSNDDLADAFRAIGGQLANLRIVE
jgi:Flp pilus assembly protein TadG